jgi:hypothetical protein
MSLRIRRGIDSERTSVRLDTGEIAWATNTKKLYVGDGVTFGGVNVLATSAGAGLEWNATTQQLDYTGALGNALQTVSEDTNPSLGGNLNLNNRTIGGTGTINFTGNISASALSLTTGLAASLPLNTHNITGTGNINITGAITSSGTLTAGNISTAGTLTTTSGLGANLSLNSYDITGTGNVNITGNISTSGTLTATAGLGANLSLNSQNITGTGNINITGAITSSSTLTAGNISTAGTLTATTGLGANLPLNGRSITGFGNIGFAGNLTTLGNITAGSTTVDGALIVYSRESAYTQLNSLATNTQFLEMQVSNGTFAAPTAVISQDILGGMLLRGYTGSAFERAVVVGGQADGAPVAGGVPGKFIVYTTNAAGTGVSILSFDKNGKLTVPSVSVGDGTATNPSIVFSTDGSVDTGFFHPADGVVCVSTNGIEKVRVDNGGMRVEGFMKVKNVAGTLPSPPEAGMIVLDGTTFKGYNGSAWVDLN